MAKQGFDDHTWWPTQDLEALVIVGQRELNELSAESSSEELKLKGAKVDGGKQKKIDGHQSEFQRKAQQVENLKSTLQPYLEELKRRRLADGE